MDYEMTLDSAAQCVQISYNDSYIIATANSIVRGRQIMTRREAQILYIVLSQITKKDRDFRTYTTTIPELASYLGIAKQSLYRDIEEICDRLLQRTIKIQVDRDWDMFQWFSEANYSHKDNRLTLKLHEKLEPYLINLSTNYTQTYLGVLLSFKSYYTSRIYQLIVCDYGEIEKDTWHFTCDQLRDFFQTGKKYKTNRALLDNTIKAAIEELSRSDYAAVLEYEEQYGFGKGKPLTGVSFKARAFTDLVHKNLWLDEHENEMKKQKMLEQLNFFDYRSTE